MFKKNHITHLLRTLVIGLALTSPPINCIADEEPIINWFGSKFGNGKKNQPNAQAKGAASVAPELVYKGTVPPADGRAWVQMATAPKGGALELVLNVIDSAKTSIRIASYSFTSKPIAEALIRKQKAGVSVMVVMDKSQLTERYTSASFLTHMGIPVRINSRYAIQHSKILVVDGDTVQTGSFNYTDSAARRNSENVLVIWHHPSLASEYTTYWQRLWEEGEPYLARY